MKILNGVVSLICLLGPVMGQGRFYRSQFDRGSVGSRNSLRGRSSTADFFNRNLQLDAVASRRGSSGGSSMATRPFGSRQHQRGGSSIQEDPAFIRRILGSTIRGRELRMGELDLPTHGGAGIGEAHADGRNNGWDGNPQTLTTQYQGSWSDPFEGRPIPQLPIGFSGDFNSVRPLFGSAGIPPFRAPMHFLLLVPLPPPNSSQSDFPLPVIVPLAPPNSSQSYFPLPVIEPLPPPNSSQSYFPLSVIVPLAPPNSSQSYFPLPVIEPLPPPNSSQSYFPLPVIVPLPPPNSSQSDFPLTVIVPLPPPNSSQSYFPLTVIVPLPPPNSSQSYFPLSVIVPLPLPNSLQSYFHLPQLV